MTEAGVSSCSLRTILVDGLLAMRMQRLEAARRGELGVQIMTLPQLAARLAGGFARPATPAELEQAARRALEAGGFEDLAPLADLPGMIRAVLRTLERLWRAGIVLDELTADHSRIADLALIEQRMRSTLQGGAHILPDLIGLALDRKALFPGLAGPTVVHRLHRIAPLWQPLIKALSQQVRLDWAYCRPPPDWATETAANDTGNIVAPNIVTCAHPQAEAIEALRWARALLATGKAQPYEIAIAAAGPQGWDDSFLGLAAGASLPVHFTHGVPALTTIEGQSCAALADVLANGLSYGRVQRLIAHSGGRCEGIPVLPSAPLAFVPADAALTTLVQWQHALTTAKAARDDQFDIAAALMPMLNLVAAGLSGAEQAGESYLPLAATLLWRAALRRAPAAALPFSLASLRIPDGKDPGANIVWGPAAHLAGAPRPWMRLIGLTSRDWPRARRDDPLLPGHILEIDPRLAPSRPELDRQVFDVLCRSATAELSLSYARRTPKGGAQAPSPLLPADTPRRRLARLRTPDHAYSDADRLQARPKDGADAPQLALPVACARARRRPVLTAHDGIVRSDHPLVLETLARTHSAASLRLLLRDPQAFVWHYALGWRQTLEEAHTLSLDDRAFGELVHQLLQVSVMLLEQGNGFAQAAEHEVEAALAQARDLIEREWPSLRAAPPPMLWQHTLDEAARLALSALQLDGPFKPGTRSWTEVGFGDAGLRSALPWDASAPVSIPGTRFMIRGRIDRVELAAGDSAVRITDYKTGTAPQHAGTIVLAGGAELQRVLYAIAARQHLPEAAVHAHLVYLADTAPARHGLDDLDAAIARTVALMNLAEDLLARGISLPGPDATARWSPYRLARPASGEPSTKSAALSQAFGPFEQVWRER